MHTALSKILNLIYIICVFELQPHIETWGEIQVRKCIMSLYYTLCFYLSLLAQPVNITLYGPGTGLPRFRNGTCIIILDKKYNIANRSCHFGSYGSIWTGPSPKQNYMDRSIYCHMTLSAMNYLLYICTLMNFVRIGKVSKSSK
jgi:hypothetical protein